MQISHKNLDGMLLDKYFAKGQIFYARSLKIEVNKVGFTQHYTKTYLLPSKNLCYSTLIATGVRPEDCERKQAKSRAVIFCCVFNIC